MPLHSIPDILTI